MGMATEVCEEKDELEMTVGDLDFRVEGGIIRDPGKFEGEEPWVVLAYDVMLNGFMDEIIVENWGCEYMMALDDETRARFGMQGGETYGVKITLNEYGFCFGYRIETQGEYDTLAGAV